MEIRFSKEKRVLSVLLKGSFDSSGAEDIRQELESLCGDETNRKIIFDMREVSYLSSFGIRELLNCVKIIDKSGGKYCFWGFNDNVRRILEKSGLTGILNIADSEKTAKRKTED